MSRRQLFLAVAAIALIAAGVAAGVLLDSEGEQVATVDHPAESGSIGAAETIEVDELDKPPPLRTRELERELEEEPGTPAPLAQAELVESTDFALTELQDPNDPRATEDAYGLFANNDVKKGASLVAEPTVAAKGDRMLVTWNWGVAFSKDGGETFTYGNPYEKPEPAPGGFCCDQLAYYIPQQDLWVWFLQYNLRGNRNVVRLALAKGDAAFDQRKFHTYDFSASDFKELDVTGEAMLDYPNISATNEHLFLGINVCAGGGCPTGLVIRMPLREVAAGDPPNYRYFIASDGGVDFVHGETNTMYFADHVDTASLRVWQWADDAESPKSAVVPHSGYRRLFYGGPYLCGRSGASRGNWCGRTTDDRVTSGWISGDTIGFAWNAVQDRPRGFPYPFVMVVRIDRKTMKLEDEPFIWNPEYAYQFAEFAPNARGDIGAMALSGGGDRYQTCTTLINDGQTQGRWDARSVAASDSDPDEDKAGDYLGIVPAQAESNIWAGSCMMLNGGSSQRNVEIRAFRFGRVKDRDG